MEYTFHFCLNFVDNVADLLLVRTELVGTFGIVTSVRDILVVMLRRAQVCERVLVLAPRSISHCESNPRQVR